MVDKIRMTAVFEIVWGISIDEILLLQARINEACHFEDTDAPATPSSLPVYTRLWTSGRKTFRDFLGALQESGQTKTTFLARHNVTAAQWAAASPENRFREDPGDRQWFHSIRRQQMYAWQYDGQGGYGVVDTTGRDIDDVIVSLAVNDLGVLVSAINIG